MPVMESRPPGGRFIALDGPDGGGKTTQAARLVEWLRSEGHEVVACRDPGGTAVGERLREILLDRQTTRLSMRTEMLLYMASRAQLVEEVIRPALVAGRTVVTDRYVLANVVYQGYAGGLLIDEIWKVGTVATGGLMPDLTLVLDVPVEVAKARVGASRDRIEDRPEAFRARVRTGFLEAIQAYPASVVWIDATASPDTVAAQLQQEVARVVGQSPRP